jgi:hypothetical protein
MDGAAGVAEGVGAAGVAEGAGDRGAGGLGWRKSAAVPRPELIAFDAASILSVVRVRAIGMPPAFRISLWITIGVSKKIVISAAAFIDECLH